jgi:hypothetical protein
MDGADPTEGSGGGGASCTNTMSEGREGSVSGNAWISYVFSYGDGVTTICLSAPVPGTVCLEGLAADACGGTDPCDYRHWGAGVGFSLTTLMGPQDVGLDALSAGITQVQFSVTSVPSTPRSGFHVGVTIMDDPVTSDVNESDHRFLLGVSGHKVIPFTTDAFGEVRPWKDFTLAPWYKASSLKLDTTKLHSLQFNLTTTPNQTVAYKFCVWGIKFLDAAGNEVIR